MDEGNNLQFETSQFEIKKDISQNLDLTVINFAENDQSALMNFSNLQDDSGLDILSEDQKVSDILGVHDNNI